MANNFSDDFNRDNSAGNAINGDRGWVEVSPGDMGIVSSQLVQSRSLAEVVAYQSGTLPGERNQVIRAQVASAAESDPLTPTFIGIGAYGRPPAAALRGFELRLYYSNVTAARTLELWVGNGILGGSIQVATATVTASTLKSGGSDLSVYQTLMLATEPIEGGMRLRAYLNEEDLDAPTLEHIVKGTQGNDTPIGWHAAQLGPDWGQWYLCGRQQVGNNLFWGEVKCFDGYSASADSVQPKDQLTLAEIRTRVLNRYSSAASNSNVVTSFLNEAIDDAVAEIVQLFPKAIGFLEGETTMDITYDTDGRFTMPVFVREVVSIWDTDSKTETLWRRWGVSAEGAEVIIFPTTSGSQTIGARVRYRMRTPHMDNDADRACIPREYSELLVYGVLYRIAETDSVPARFQVYMTGFQRCLARIKAKESGRRQRNGVVWGHGQFPGKRLARNRTSYP